MKEKAKAMIKDNIEILNSINNILEFFKKDPKLTSFKKSFEIKDKSSGTKEDKEMKHFFISFERSKKYKNCLNLRFDDIGSSFKDNGEFHYLSFEEVEFENVLKRVLFVFITIYGLKNLKFTLNENLQEKTKSYY